MLMAEAEHPGGLYCLSTGHTGKPLPHHKEEGDPPFVWVLRTLRCPPPQQQRDLGDMTLLPVPPSPGRAKDYRWGDGGRWNQAR